MSTDKYSFFFHPETDADFDEAYSWSNSQDANLGERFATQIGQKLDQILASSETYGAKSRKLTEKHR